MTGNSKATLAAAVAGGYVLGRTKKGKLALTAALFLAGRRIITDPKQLLAEGLHKLSQTPQFSQLSEQVRNDLLGAGGAALRGVVNRRVESLCDKIHDRTAALQRGPGGDDGNGEDGNGEDGDGHGDGDDGNGEDGNGEDGDGHGDGDNGDGNGEGDQE